VKQHCHRVTHTAIVTIRPPASSCQLRRGDHAAQPLSTGWVRTRHSVVDDIAEACISRVATVACAEGGGASEGGTHSVEVQPELLPATPSELARHPCCRSRRAMTERCVHSPTPSTCSIEVIATLNLTQAVAIQHASSGATSCWPGTLMPPRVVPTCTFPYLASNCGGSSQPLGADSHRRSRCRFRLWA
jgi:hypothetical protein